MTPAWSGLVTTEKLSHRAFAAVRVLESQHQRCLVNDDAITTATGRYHVIVHSPVMAVVGATDPGISAFETKSTFPSVRMWDAQCLAILCRGRTRRPVTPASRLRLGEAARSRTATATRARLSQGAGSHMLARYKVTHSLLVERASGPTLVQLCPIPPPRRTPTSATKQSPNHSPWPSQSCCYVPC